MQILLTVPNVPYPLLSGGHYRDWQIVNLLARMGKKPHLLYFGAGEGGLLAAASPVESLCASITYGGSRVDVPDRGRWQTAMRKLGYLTGFGGETFPFSYQYDTMDAGRLIVETALQRRVDIVVLRSFWCHHTPALKAAGLDVIANCPDYNTRLALEMVRSMRTTLRKIGPLCNYFGVRRQERTFLPLCDEVWSPTEDEANELERIVCPENILVMPNLLDVESYPDYSTEIGDGATMLFVANYGYAPNMNAARLLLTEMFPAVKARVPAARLILVGRGLPPDLIGLAKEEPDVELMGFVEDLHPYYRRASIVLLPVLEGAGMLVKTLEALSYGKAVVGFQQCFRGLGFEENPPYLVASTTRAFAEQAANLLNNPEFRAGMARRTRAYAVRHASWERGDEIMKRSRLAR